MTRPDRCVFPSPAPFPAVPDRPELVALAFAGWLPGLGAGLEAILDRVEGRA